MAIPEAQLATWCNQGATASAQATHTSVRYALETARTSLLIDRDIEIFLQGSYRNFTNIFSDSDVDIVVQLNETYTRDSSLLIGPQREAEQRDFTRAQPAPYPWDTFRADVLESLRRYYGNAPVVQQGNKAIKLQGGAGRLAADVVPALVHHLYTSYVGLFIAPTSVEGISFWDQFRRQIINYPKQHIENGEQKNGFFRTNGNYKPIVRMFKNARRYAVGRGLLGAGAAPSYFVECLLSNVPDHLFVSDRQQAMLGILNWLRNSEMAVFMCQNGRVLLFGPTPEQWNLFDAARLVMSLVRMWDNWPV
jgi:hypothetical protein